MNLNKYIKTSPIFLSFFLIAAICISGGYYIMKLKQSLIKESQEYLTEISIQSGKLLRTQIRGDIQSLRSMVNVFEKAPELTEQYLMDVLTEENFKNPFKRMGVIGRDGWGKTTDGYISLFTEDEFFNNAMAGYSSVSGTMEDGLDGGKKVNNYAVPIQQGDSVVAVLFATMDSNVYSNMISINSFGGAGYSYVVDKNGDVVIKSNNANSDPLFNNIFDENIVYQSESEKARFKDDMRCEKIGWVVYYNKNVSSLKCMSYAPIGVNEWYILSVTPMDLITQKSNDIVSHAIRICVMIILILSALIIYIYNMKRSKEKDLRKIAFTDNITGGGNWNKFKVDARNILDSHGDKKYALLIFDINRFKVINDLFGYNVGNGILKDIVRIIKPIIDKDEVFARAGADNFALLMKYKNDRDILHKMNLIMEKIKEIYLGDNIVFSFGIYHILDYSMDINIINDRAVLAKSTIKGNHKLNYAFYDDVLRDQSIEENRIENDMKKGLENEEFILYYQAKIDLKSGKMDSAEALIRWNHPERGFLSPAKFIPVFEKNGSIIDIDNYVFEKVCKQLRIWMDRGLNPGPIAVNVSRVHLFHKEFVEQFSMILKKYDIMPSMIELELTESAMFENKDIMVEILECLKEKGFIISMDDFGAGYSSLNILKELPVDVLKIDGAFFTGSPEEYERSKVIIKTIISMARQLHITTVAEGVEKKEQVEFLTEIGCDRVQGYYFAKPISCEEFEKTMLL